MNLFGKTAPFFVFAGILVAFLGTMQGRMKEAISLGLDLWTAASLLYLSTNLSWTALLVAAIVLVLRHSLVSPARF